MERQTKDLRTLKVKVQDGNQIKRVNVRYRSEIYNRIMINSLINRDTKRYLVSLCGLDLIMKLERVVGEELGEGMEGLRRVMERYKREGGGAFSPLSHNILKKGRDR